MVKINIKKVLKTSLENIYEYFNTMSNLKKASNKDPPEATAMDEPLFEELQVGEGPSPEPTDRRP